ncbi:MAG: branched-chain amino acid transport system II carrier protein [Vagococcus sp.]
MEKKLTFKQRIYIGSMIFGLFFGAGNLIFPIQMGQEAGANIFWANLGFLITGIGLPFLGIIAFGLSNSRDLIELASRVGDTYAKLLTTTLFLVIGPLFAMPRLATTSFEIALKPFVTSNRVIVLQAFFSIVFFLLVWFFSRKPSKILDYIGKFLTPIFLILLSIILLLGFLKPLGSVSEGAVQPAYQQAALLRGFTNGYNTLDALAALAFGMIVVESIKGMDVLNPKSIAKETTKSGFMGIVLMGIIYTLLSYLGAMSLGEFSVNQNGGITLAQIANYYLGTFGSVLLAFIVIIACLKTAIGLATAFGRTFSELYVSKSYLIYVTGCIILATLVANVGLTTIIKISIPVLMFIYPLAMTLILMGMFSSVLDKCPVIYKTVTYLTLIAASLDALNAMPGIIKGQSAIAFILEQSSRFIPLFDMGLGWVMFSIIGVILGYMIHRAKA